MSVHNGHRERMRQEFLSGGLAHFSEPRVLELLLFYSRPRGDVNPLAHNHPSGVATPSQEDIFLTHYVQQSLQPLGITLYDHVILTDDDMVSLRDSRHLTPPSAF